MKFPLENKLVFSSWVKKCVLLFLLLGFQFKGVAIDCIPDKPTGSPFLVYDNTGTLSANEINSLENDLVNFSKTTSNQIVVVLLNDLCGYSGSEFGTALGEQWGVGKENKDNGIVILIKPTGSKSERVVAIEIGRGLEAVITDGTAKLIEKNEMIPSFKKGEIYQGIVNALNVLKPLAKKEFSEADYAKRGPGIGMIVLVVLIIIVVIAFKFFQAKTYSQQNHVGLWQALWLMSMMNSGGVGRGSWGNFSGGSGGFGGFGGGSFGGGGAESSW